MKKMSNSYAMEKPLTRSRRALPPGRFQAGNGIAHISVGAPRRGAVIEVPSSLEDEI